MVAFAELRWLLGSWPAQGMASRVQVGQGENLVGWTAESPATSPLSFRVYVLRAVVQHSQPVLICHLEAFVLVE